MINPTNPTGDFFDIKRMKKYIEENVKIIQLLLLMNVWYFGMVQIGDHNHYQIKLNGLIN